MDVARFETLETHVVNLVQAFARTKEENKQLCQNVKQLRDALDARQEELARLRLDQEELTHLRMVMQTLQQERHAIREKLEQMLLTIEWLEEHARVDARSKA
jgi:predicted  nucleic acid-binding Zn-ribbon protein